MFPKPEWDFCPIYDLRVLGGEGSDVCSKLEGLSEHQEQQQFLALFLVMSKYFLTEIKQRNVFRFFLNI